MEKHDPRLGVGNGTAGVIVVLVVVVVVWAVLKVNFGTVEKISSANFCFVFQHLKMISPFFGKGFVGEMGMEKRPGRIFKRMHFKNTGRVKPASTIGRQIEPKYAALHPSRGSIRTPLNSSISNKHSSPCSV